MDRIATARELIRVARIVMAKDLAEVKTKRTAIRKAYDMVDDLTRGYCDDPGWNRIWEVVKRLQDGGFEVECWVENGGYDSQMTCKRYVVRLEFDNNEGRHFQINGNLIGMFQEPGDLRSPYTVTMTLY